jgi:hypothetical protein
MVEPRGSMAKLAQRAEGALRPTFCPTFCPTHCPTHLPAPFQPLGSALASPAARPSTRACARAWSHTLRPSLSNSVDVITTSSGINLISSFGVYRSSEKTRKIVSKSSRALASSAPARIVRLASAISSKFEPRSRGTSAAPPGPRPSTSRASTSHKRTTEKRLS